MGTSFFVFILGGYYEDTSSFSNNISENYYGPWIEAYARVDFENFSIRSLEFVDSICKNIDEKEEEKLINIFLTACEYEMKFWDMSYE